HRIVFSRDGSRLLTASDDRLATVWEVASGGPVLRMLHGDYVNDATFSPDESLIVTAREQGVRGWDAKTGEAIASYLAVSPRGEQAWRVQFSPDRHPILACSQPALSGMLCRLPRDERTEAEWLDLAAVISGQHVLNDGRVEALTPLQLARVW